MYIATPRVNGYIQEVNQSKFRHTQNIYLLDLLLFYFTHRFNLFFGLIYKNKTSEKATAAVQVTTILLHSCTQSEAKAVVICNTCKFPSLSHVSRSIRRFLVC